MQLAEQAQPRRPVLLEPEARQVVRGERRLAPLERVQLDGALKVALRSNEGAEPPVRRRAVAPRHQVRRVRLQRRREPLRVRVGVRVRVRVKVRVRVRDKG